MENNVDNDQLLVKFVENVEEFLTHTEEARFYSERDRDYKDNKQWTAEEKAEIEKRWQAAITVNRIHPKVEGLKGLLIERKTDPKAFARTRKHEKAAEAVSDALRYVADNNKFDKIKIKVADNVFVEGYGAAITDVIDRGQEKEIVTTYIPWDRYYFDYHSRELDFSDKRWDGIVVWMDEEVAKETFDLSDEEVSELYESSTNTFETGYETFDDRPRWADKKDKRIRICQHFYIHKGQWHICYFTNSKMLIEPTVSPYVNEYDEPINPIEGVTAYLDRDNNRFGEVRYWIDLQDEVNHRRSKFLFLLSQRQTMARRGSVQDVPALKRELAKPNGHIEYDGDKGDFDIIPTNDMASGQYDLLQEAKYELDRSGFNAPLSGDIQGELSNKAITNLQNAGTYELSSLYENLLDWENRVYRQYWFRIRQFWNQEKWIRVLDDTTQLRWVGLNQPITLQQLLEETAQDVSLPLPMRQEAVGTLDQMMQQQYPGLQQIVETRNPIPELDVDIIIETSYDLVNIQREQFDMLFKLAQVRPEVPFTELLKMSELRNKDVLVKNIEQAQQRQEQLQQQVMAENNQREMMETQSDVELNAAKTHKEHAEARKRELEGDQTAVQTELMLETPPEDTGVVI